MEQGPSSGRPGSISSFLPAKHPPAGVLSLSGRVALVEVRSRPPGNVKEILSRGLAARFGGPVEIIGWLIFGGLLWRSSSRTRGHLVHKAWIRLHHWLILCWNEEDVKAAVSGFGELWNIDPLIDSRMDVSFFRAYIRCQHVQNIPEVINLMVEDRRFKVLVEVESWEEANPILLGEDLDGHLGHDCVDAQESFIHLTGFSSVPARQPLEQHRRSDAPPILSGHFVVFGCTPLLLPAPAPAPGSKPTPYALEGPPSSHRKGKAAMDVTPGTGRALPVACPDPPYVYTYKASTTTAEIRQEIEQIE
uniref:DUF4283 domain-containing protein n=1 Tax=Ananas comosus var. bracteatus TaxID=296719 RepID=A0A6V7NIZ3_ANACO|nr:unnamed protein product [Ananas comosus var. bracteatus]